MLRIAICDDESNFVEEMNEYIIEYLFKKEIQNFNISKYTSSLEFYEAVETGVVFDAIFLDINMPDLDGIYLAKWLRAYSEKTILVFITSFLDYAIEGYRLQIFRFILKDMMNELLPECMDAILCKLTMKQSIMSFNFVEGKRAIVLKDLVYIGSSKHKVQFHFISHNIYSLYDKLDHLENQLIAFGFLRIHKSFLVNMAYIQEINNYQVKLQTSDCLPIPREKYQIVRKQYYAFQGGLL